MPDHAHIDDVLDNIDQALETDGMRSVPDSDSPDTPPDPLIVRMSLDRAELMELNSDDPSRHVAELVGDPNVARVSFGLFDAWVGDNSEASGQHNPGNVLMIKPLLRDIAAGNLAAPDKARDHIHDLLNTDQVPQLYGPVVLSGPIDEHHQPTGLSETMLTWVSNHRREQLAGVVHRTIAAVLATDAREAIEAALARGDVGVIVLGEQRK